MNAWTREKAEAEEASDLRILRDDPETWERIVEFLAELFGTEGIEKLRGMIEADDEWWAGIHFAGGMDIRNRLRDNGFDEAELGIANLDNVYVELLEEVAK